MVKGGIPRRSPIRDLTKLRQRGQRERRKSNRFNEQNNNSARASRFFVHFFAIPPVVSARVNEARCQNLACRADFFSACKWGLSLLENRNGKREINSSISV